MSFRVDERLKKRMEALAHLNWSEVLRQYVSRVVTEEKAKSQRKRDSAAIAEAMATIDDLRSRSQSGWSGAEEIKKWKAKTLVLDASVLVKWFNNEEHTDKALDVKDLYERGKLNLVETELVTQELGNSLRYNPNFGVKDVR